VDPAGPVENAPRFPPFLGRRGHRAAHRPQRLCDDLSQTETGHKTTTSGTLTASREAGTRGGMLLRNRGPMIVRIDKIGLGVLTPVRAPEFPSSTCAGPSIVKRVVSSQISTLSATRSLFKLERDCPPGGDVSWNFRPVTRPACPQSLGLSRFSSDLESTNFGSKE